MVSIVVPVYNVEQYLPRCIDSILNQTYRDFQLILVDDGSSDRCCDLCDEYAEKDNRIAAYHKENGGVSSARNVGIQYAQGEYITFCDSDDAYALDWIERLVTAAEENSADVVVGNYTQVFEDGRKGRPSNHVTGRIDTDTMEKKVGYCFDKILSMSHGWEMCLRLFRTEIIREHGICCCETCGNYAEDMGFVLAYSVYANRVVSIDAQGYLYTMRSNSMMHTTSGKARLELIDEVFRFITPVFRRVFQEPYVHRILDCLRYQMLIGHFEAVMWSEHYPLEEYREMAISDVPNWPNMRNFIKSHLRNPDCYNRFYSGSENLDRKYHALFLLGSPWLVLRIRLKLIRMFRPVADAWGRLREKGQRRRENR